MKPCPCCGKPIPDSIDRCPTCGAVAVWRANSDRSVSTTVILGREIPATTSPPPLQIVDGTRAVEGAKTPKTLRRTAVEKPSSGRPATSLTEHPQPLPFRPRKRTPIAQLVVLNDGSRLEGEARWIRSEDFTIGRTRGDLLIQHDRNISAKHAQIFCRWQDGGYRWGLRDLGSTNGTFVRTSRAILRHGREFLFGGRRYALRATEAVPRSGAPGTSGSDQQPTRRRDDRATSKLIDPAPTLIGLTGDGEGAVLQIQSNPTWIGSDIQKCQAVVKGDPFINPVQARVYRHKRGYWVIEDADSLNGLWMRIEVTALGDGDEFQLGEQRFLFRLVPAGTL